MSIEMQQSNLQSYMRESKDLSREDFMARHPHPFLVQEAALNAPKDDELVFATVEFSDSEMAALDSSFGPEALGRRQVIAVVTEGAQEIEGMVNVGRTPNNDIVPESGAVSKFHAYFMHDRLADEFSVTDAGSTNGTFLNGKRLAPDVKHVLADRDLVAFGQACVYQFYSAGPFYDLLKVLAV